MATLPENQEPSVNPADKDTLAGAFRFILKKNLQNTDDMLPATIVAYDRVTNLATVQPMVKLLTTGNQVLSRAPLASIPVFAFGGGKFFVNFPLVAGNTGWIKANDRDISLYVQSMYSQTAPNTDRLHSFSDGMFFPDIMADYTIDPLDMEAAVFQFKDSTNKVVLYPDGNVVIKGDVAKVTMDKTGKYSFEGAGGEELMTILYDLLAKLLIAQVVPAVPFNAATIANLTAIQSRIAAIKLL